MHVNLGHELTSSGYYNAYFELLVPSSARNTYNTLVGTEAKPICSR